MRISASGKDPARFPYLDALLLPEMKQRLLSIDVLRGMTIFFMIVVNTPGSWTYVYAPLRHAPWDGLTPTDLVFPFFVFIVGLSMAFSFRKYNVGDRRQWLLKIARRTALIFSIGLLLNWYPFFNKALADLRIFGVLQRIAVAYGLAALIVVFARKSAIPIIFALILFAYWALLLLCGGAQPLSLEENAVRMLDLYLLGEDHVYGGYGIPFDPEGILSSLPAVGTVLFGYWIGITLQKKDHFSEQIKLIWPLGLVAVLAGVAWHLLGFPINKPLWSSSYVLATGGLATLLLCLLIYVIDIKGWKGWTLVFQVFGLNPLISYVLSGLVLKTIFLLKIGDQHLYSWLYGSVFQGLITPYAGSFAQAILYTMFIWLFAYYLFVHKRVIKI